MNFTQAWIRNKGEPVGKLVGRFIGNEPRQGRGGLTPEEGEGKPQVVGSAHSSEEDLETDWSEGAELLKCLINQNNHARGVE